MRKLLWLLLLLATPTLAQVSNPGVRYVGTAPSGACAYYPPIQVVESTGVPWTCNNGTWAAAGGSGSSGFPITIGGASIAASSTTTAIDSLASLQNVKYLSAGSDLGAQCNAAVTALGAAGGIIQLPNSTSLTMTTTCTNIPQRIWIRGYGKFATKIACSVAAADCFQITQNPTTNGAIGGIFSGFEIDGASSANPILIHGTGASGWTFDDIQFQPYGGSSANAAVCLELENNASGIFTERNTITSSVGFERQCTTGLYLHQDGSGDSSFGYNNFHVNGVSQGANYLVVADGNASPYGGFLTIEANHVGPGGGVLQFNGTAGSSGPANPSEFLNITAEEDGSGAGEVIDATSSGTMNFTGTLINGGGGAPALATLIGGTNAANVLISNAFGAQGPTTTNHVGLATDKNSANLSQTTARAELCPNIGTGNTCEILVGHDNGTGNAALLQLFYEGSNNAATRGILGMPGKPSLEWDISANVYMPGEAMVLGDGTLATIQQIGAHSWYNEVNSSGQWFEFDVTNSTTPFYITTTGSPYNNAVGTGANSIWGWSSQAQFANNAALDTGLSRTAAGSVAVGNGTQGDFSGTLQAARLVLKGGTVPTITGCGTITAQAGGVAAGTFTTSTTGTCAAAITLPTATHGYTCVAQDITQHSNTNALIQSATSATGCTVTGTTVANDVITFVAFGW